MKKLRNMRRPRLATIVAGLALMVALGGTATASGLISGNKIKNKTITGKKIKNKTITRNKLAPATVKALKGQRGPAGPAGAKGEKGDPGANGVVAPTTAVYGSTNLPANTELALGITEVPAGKYLITANARVFSTGTANMGCVISANAGGGFSETSTWNSPVANSRNTIPMQLVTNSSTVTQVSVACHPGNINGSASADLVITPIQ